MTGIEILATREIYHTILPIGWGIIGFFLMFGSVILALIALIELENIKAIICGIVAICGIILFVAGLIPDETNIDYIEHKVTISDEVQLNEFNEKYEIIEQDGKIYTVRERE